MKGALNAPDLKAAAIRLAIGATEGIRLKDRRS